MRLRWFFFNSSTVIFAWCMENDVLIKCAETSFFNENCICVCGIISDIHYLNFVHLKLFELNYNGRTFEQNFSNCYLWKSEPDAWKTQVIIPTLQESIRKNLSESVSKLILRYRVFLRYVFSRDYSNLLRLLIDSRGITDRESKERNRYFRINMNGRRYID